MSVTKVHLSEVSRYAPAGCIEVVGHSDEKRFASSIVSVTGSVNEVIAQIQGRRTVVGSPLSIDKSIVVLASPVIGDLDWTFQALTSVAAAAGASALAVCLPPDRTHLPRVIVQLADRLRLVILIVRDPWLFTVATLDLLAGVAHLEGKLLRAITTQCSRPVASLDELLHRVSGTIGHSVNLVDRTGQTIARTTDTSITAPQETEFAAIGAVPGNTKVAVAVPVLTSHGRSRSLEVQLTNTSQGQQHAIAAALEVAALAVCELLTRQRVDLERSARGRAALLSDLLESGHELTPALYQRARDAGWSMDGYHMAARAIVRTEIDLVGRRSDLDDALHREGLDAVTVEQSDGWAMWFTVESQPEAASAGGWGMAWRRVQQHLSATIPIQLGVGRIHHGIAGLARSLAEATDAARIAAGRERSGYFVQIDRLDMAQRLLAWMSTESFLPAARELLSPLAGRPDLIATLTTYLDTESSLVETAAVLGVHRNTVRDRIARIRGDLAVDFDDPDTRLALHLACRSTLSARQT